MPIYVASDRISKFDEQMDYSLGMPEIIPVDLNGARTDFPKGQDNLKKAERDIQVRFGLETLGPSVRGGETS